MRRWVQCLLAAGCLLGIAPQGLADFYDLFADGQYCQNPNEPNVYDPNFWDRDNPHWATAVMQADANSFSAEDGYLKMWADGGGYLTFQSAWVDSGNHDANTSDTWFDASGSFYLLSRVIWPSPDPNNPNDPNTNGAGILGICLDPNRWACYGLAFNPRDGQAILGSLTFSQLAVASLASTYMTGLSPRDGVWILMGHGVQQWDPNDPNTVTKTLRAALWGGGKFDWSGQYDLEFTYRAGRNVYIASNLVHPDGLCGVGVCGYPGGRATGASQQSVLTTSSAGAGRLRTNRRRSRWPSSTPAWGQSMSSRICRTRTTPIPICRTPCATRSGRRLF
jgi:hypothetical protein